MSGGVGSCRTNRLHQSMFSVDASSSQWVSFWVASARQSGSAQSVSFWDAIAMQSKSSGRHSAGS